VNVDHLPAVLTAAETAAFLRVSERVVYEACREYLATGGAEGIPCVRIGRRNLRIPRAALEQLINNASLNGNGAPNGDGA
jgi:hypothetical protein